MPSLPMPSLLRPVAAAALLIGLSTLAGCAASDLCDHQGICRKPQQATPLDPFAQQRRQSLPRD